mmetsp:Transcript_74727/g.173071  ORF Transcript_74727/g.173071 Transcript_74727/m.173071 type:complete len:85 (+) Transcript_74727:113-367(+)
MELSKASSGQLRAPCGLVHSAGEHEQRGAPCSHQTGKQPVHVQWYAGVVGVVPHTLLAVHPSPPCRLDAAGEWLAYTFLLPHRS